MIPPFKADAYTLEAVVEAGVPARIARKLLADGPANVPERPRTSLVRRGRASETRAYVWGPDAVALLLEPANGFTGHSNVSHGGDNGV